MAILQRLEISRLRNLVRVLVAPASNINIFHGDNGSGKTSLLEAIHMLGLGRSFRSNKLDSVIQDTAEECVIFGELAGGITVGLSKSRRQNHVLKLQGSKQRNWADTARCIPLQVINAESFSLLEGSPKVRRRFLDWGVFHVEHEFVVSWRDAAKCLAHRNLLLKKGGRDTAQLAAWDAELANLAEKIDTSRRSYFADFLPVALQTIKEVIQIQHLSIDYWRGWDDGSTFLNTLAACYEKDFKYGATQQGPHRADIIVRVGKRPATEVLSRGQQKLLVSALKIAQGRLLSTFSGAHGIYLVDDLPSELDRRNRALVCSLLANLGSQIFLTSVEAGDLENSFNSEVLVRKFHVEHGKIAPSNRGCLPDLKE